jgi:hypothetical protein
VLGTNLVGLAIVVFRRDVVWTVGATWLNAALFSQRPKPVPVYVRPSLPLSPPARADRSAR